MPIINMYILPGTTIHSDEWAAYATLGQEGYQHGTVNHTLHFIESNTVMHTNRVEAVLFVHLREGRASLHWDR